MRGSAVFIYSAFIELCNHLIFAGTVCDRLSSLQFYEEKLYSQNGEDGVLVTLLDIIKVKYSSYVEFGVEDGIECNTRILREHFGFHGLMMDGGHENTAINLHQELITVSNVLNLFQKYHVVRDFDVLSIDVDMFDFWIMAKLLGEGHYRPRIIIVETNPTLCLNIGKIGPNRMKDYSQINSLPLTVIHPNMTDQIAWDLSRYAGANPLSFQLLGKEFGYETIHCERCGVNCFLVLRTELPIECQKDYPLPTVPYPCFGTARTGLAYPGHEIDLLERSAVKVSPQLLQGIKSGTFTVADVEASTISCSSRMDNPSILQRYS